MEKDKVETIKSAVQKVMTNLNHHFLKGDGKNGSTSSGAWTSQLFKLLADEALKLNYTACSSKLNACENSSFSEWLFDHCWLEWKKGEQVRLKNIVLALESEWSTSPNDILSDFEKLLICRADVRVMVFQQRSEDKVQEVFNRLRGAVGGFEKSVNGDEYLFFGYDMKHRIFINESCTYEKQINIPVVTNTRELNNYSA